MESIQLSCSSITKLNKINSTLSIILPIMLYCFPNNKLISCRLAKKLIKKYLLGNIEYVKATLYIHPELLFYSSNNKNILHHSISKGDTSFILFLLEFAQNILPLDLYNKWLQLTTSMYKSYYSYPIKTYNIEVLSILLRYIPLNNNIILDLISCANNTLYDNTKCVVVLRYLIEFVNEYNKIHPLTKISLPIISPTFSYLYILLKPSNTCNIYDYNLTELLELLIEAGLDVDTGGVFKQKQLGWLEYILHPMKSEKISVTIDNFDRYLLKNLSKIYYLYFFPKIKSNFLMKFLRIEETLQRLKEEIFSYYVNTPESYRYTSKSKYYLASPLGKLTYYYIGLLPFFEYLNSDKGKFQKTL